MDEKLMRRFEEERQIATKRVGNSPVQRLQWLLNFKDQNLAELSLGERQMLGWCLRALPMSKLMYAKRVSQDIHWSHPMEPLADELLTVLQMWTRNLFAAMQAQREFELPRPSKILLWRQSPLTSKSTRFQYIKHYFSRT
jgi:hypothetical protein